MRLYLKASVSPHNGKTYFLPPQGLAGTLPNSEGGAGTLSNSKGGAPIQRVYFCGCCEQYHRADWFGDCREDGERLNIEDIDSRFGVEGVGWEEIAMEDLP